VIEAPPVFAGAVHETRTWVLPNEPAMSVGASGALAGTTDAEAVDAEPAPALFVEVTVNVYVVPFVRPVTMQLVVEVVHESEPGDEVTV